MEARIDTSFHIDRMSGFGIVVPVKAGIIQEFDDHEYHGHLSSKVVGKHITVLKELVETKLYKTRVHNFDLFKAYTETGIKNIEYTLLQLRRRLSELDKTIVPPTEGDYFYNRNSRQNYEIRMDERKLNISQVKEQIKEAEKKFAIARNVIEDVKQKIFEEHGIQY